MAKGKVKNGKSETKKHDRITRKQRRNMEKSLLNATDPEDLEAQLRNFGLCTKNITGDGNCLFRSLSDQYYGQDGNHKAIRQEICQYLRDNEETYKFFVEDDQSFEHHVECMSRNATFGGNMEVVAFAKLKKVDIKVYQPGLIYVINGVDEEEQADDDDEERQTLHIAYHSSEHYDSVRNIDGPYSGPPEIKVTERKHKEAEEKTEEVEDEFDSKEKVVLNACPNASIRKIRRLLAKYKGDPDKVIDVLYELENNSKENDETNVEENKRSSKKKVEETAVNTEDLSQQIDETKKKVEEETIDEKEEIKLEVEPKKLSASERKKEAKRKQKENKLLKERAKAARKAKYKQEKVQESPSTIENNMKEMYI